MALSIYQLKPRFQALLRPWADSLAARGVSANQVTLAAALLSLIWGGALALWPGAALPLLGLPLVLFARMALNALDGMLAGEHGQASKLGAILNELGDLVSDAALYLPFALIPGVPGALVVLLMTLALIGEAAGMLAPSLGASRRYDGPLGKSDRAFLFGFLALLLGLGLAPGGWLDLLLWLALALGLLTLVNRVRRALKEAGP
ncbi:MAG: CDP-alcohol phosphatidyltransferase family protein [Rhodospirillales bacterium]|nr:CDP-alcohol phosphatidyltransferase family protein [Rhodospirillales bacterium]